MSLTVLSRGPISGLTTIANVRLDLGAAVTALPDSQLERFIAQASATITSSRGRGYGHAAFRQRFDAIDRPVDDDGGTLLLDVYPVFRISSVVADGRRLPPEAWELAGSALHRVDRRMPRRWHARSVIVEYEAGYRLPGEDPTSTLAPGLPAGVEANVIAEVNRLAHARGRDPMVMAEQVVGVGGTSRAGPLPPQRGNLEASAPYLALAETGDDV